MNNKGDCMDNQLFIDTGAYIAKFHKNDRKHQVSCNMWDIIKNNKNLMDEY